MKDYKVTKALNRYFIGSTVIDSFVSSNICEGGLTIVFEKIQQRGIAILGYTELGEWIEYLQVGNKVIEDNTLGDIQETDYIKEIAKEYNVS